jgi:hypothetical protein
MNEAILKPFGPRVLVADPPMDSSRTSVLIIVGEVHHVKKGIVIEVGDEVPYLEPGDVVYYQENCEVEIASYKIINANCVLAYEKEDR